MTTSPVIRGHFDHIHDKGRRTILWVALEPDEGMLLREALGPEPHRARSIPVALVVGAPAESLGDLVGTGSPTTDLVGADLVEVIEEVCASVTPTAAPKAASASATRAPEPAGDDEGWEWAVVEVFGHRRHVGRIREVERFGAKMMRLDVPKGDDPASQGWTSHFYAGGSLFSITPTDRESALRANRTVPLPSRYALPAPDGPDDDDGEYR